ncbi:MAG TPA: response regulator [Bryocella sp.]|nr:response regulator [Bryocella sp.]
MTRKRNILVVDDEPNVLLTYRLILQQQGYAVSAALSSDEARNAIRDQDIDMLLCDLSLEKQESGFDVIDFARQKDPGLPTVLLTGYATPEATEHAGELAIPILFKPIDIKELLDTISGLLKENYEQHKAAGEDGPQDQERKKRGAKVAAHRDGSSSGTGA